MQILLVFGKIWKCLLQLSVQKLQLPAQESNSVVFRIQREPPILQKTDVSCRIPESKRCLCLQPLSFSKIGVELLRPVFYKSSIENEKLRWRGCSLYALRPRPVSTLILNWFFTLYRYVLLLTFSP